MTDRPPMTSGPRELATGSPRFPDARLQALAARGDTLGAWRTLLQAGDSAAAIAGVAGPFAMAGNDGRGRQWLAVDRFGQHSLCYRVMGGELRFATRADALADADNALEPQALFDYLYFHVIPSPRTVYAGVHRLPPGHCAVFDGRQLLVRPYWQPAFDEARAPSFAEQKAEFLRLVQQAVTAARDAEHPACFLSGGTDSSTVAGMLAQLEGPRPATYSIGFDAQGYDEMAYARLAAQRFGTDHHEYYVTPDDLVQGIPVLAASLDQPFGNSSCLPAWCCARLAQQDGVRRLLAGDGGDELFGGNARYAKQRLFGWYAQVPGGVRRRLIEPLTAWKPATALPLVRKAGSYVEQARMPMPDRLQLYNLVMRLGPREVLGDALLARVDPAASLALQREVWAQTPPGCSELNRELAYDWRFTLAESDLPKVNAACALAGVDVAFPLLDDALLDFSLRLPSNWKLKGPQLRWFFKEALRGFLPEEIITKKKHGFGLPFGVWTLSTPALRSLAADSLHTLAERGVVRQSFVTSLLGQRLAEHPGYYGEMVWILMLLEQWLRAKAPSYRVA